VKWRRNSSAFEWPERSRAALSFSFDDARESQIQNGLPLFERLGVSATFFVMPNAVAADAQSWTQAVQRGHEIGNHTVSHPCGRTAAWRAGDALYRMTLKEMRAELLAASARIRQLLSVDPWSFAYPCGQTFVGRGTETQSYVPVVAELFGVGRTFNEHWANSPVQCDLAQVACVCSDGAKPELAYAAFDQAVAEGEWLVLGGHEIAESGQVGTTSVELIETIGRRCRERDVWVDTVGAVGWWIAAARA
jgi:peptidoglycan/xylan/chitin deacetylase (PgdA/CDA1 family)